MTHTPVPWNCDEAILDYETSECVCEIFSVEHEQEAIAKVFSEDDAQFIVKACNERGNALELIADLANALRERLDDSTDAYSAIVEQADDYLTKAEQE